jgi:Flp pilus assembly protein TadD
MARAPQRSGKRPRPNARPRAGGGAARVAPTPERTRKRKGGGRDSWQDQLFFSRLRRHAKWMFVLLAVVFAVGFVGFGVGSGSSGIGDLLQGNFSNIFGGGSSGPSISKAQKKVDKHPSDPAAYRQLATAYQAKGRTDDAMAALRQLIVLRPKDTKALSNLGALQLSRASKFRTDVQNAQAAEQAAYAQAPVTPDTSSKLGQALSTDPIGQAVSGQLGGAVSTAQQNMTSAYTDAVTTYKQLAKVSPSDSAVQFQLAQAAESASDYKTAIAAYKRFVTIAPDDPTVPAIKQRIKQLELFSKIRPTTGG